MLKSFFYIMFAAWFFTSCTSRRKSEVIWDKDHPIIGSQSSPRATDLNSDGVLDIVMGAGKNEYQASDQGVIAFDGKTGNILWQAASQDQVYGSATLYDVTGDGIDDVFIGGRSPHFMAFDGTNGSLLWEYKFQYEQHPILRYAKYNFNNSVLIPDQNGDGLRDLLTVNGGNSYAAPYSDTDRFPGVMMIFDSRHGHILAADTMPDGRESYMSPVSFIDGDEDVSVIFGTGGETISGNLYRTDISSLLNNKLHLAEVIASEKGHGFIAPPSIVDITGDKNPDIVAISHGSTVFAIDGAKNNLLWKRTIPDTECSNSFAVGQFTGDETPDLFTFVSRGMWPNSTGSVQVMLNGKSGEIEYLDSLGCTGFSSPVIVDANRDGFDDAIISINEYNCKVGFTGDSPSTIQNRIVLIDFKKRSIQTIDQQPRFKNIFSTPWIGDLDDDGYLDLISCQYFHHGNLLNFVGMRIKRIGTPIRINEPLRWGAYMGSDGSGVYH